MFANTDTIAVDTETTGLNPWTGDRFFGCSMASAEEETHWLEFPVDPFTREVNYGGKWLDQFNQLATVLENPKIEKVFFNAQYDLRMLEFADIQVAGQIQDLSIAARVCGVDRMYWKLKPLCKMFFDIADDDEAKLKKTTQTLRNRAKLLGYKLGEVVEQDYWLQQYASSVMLGGLHQLKTWQNASETKQKQLDQEARDIAKEMRSDCKTYGVQDVVRTIVGWLYFSEELKQKKLWKIYRQEMDLMLGVTYKMVSRGIQTNSDTVRHGVVKAKQQLALARWKLNKTFWNGFNPNSVNDKRRYFIDYKRLLPLNHSKKTMNPSIDETFLAYYAKREPGAKAIIDHVSAGKAESTYFNWMVSNHDGSWVLHPDLNQFGTLTGRFSGRFLTIPKRAKPGSIMLDVRRCFVPRENHYWLLGDYSQIEARIYADEFEESTMIKAFANGEDVYTALEQTILDNTKIDVGRQVAKNIFLGKIYGLGLDHLIEMILEESHSDVDHYGAEQIVKAFDDTFPIVAESMQKVARRVERMGFVRNRYGQILYVPFDYAYKGVNYIIQSTAQRVIKEAMLRIAKQLKRLWHDVHLILQIHDELVFEVHEKIDAQTLALEIKDLMEQTDKFPHVKLTADFEICTDNWLEKKELEL